MLNNLSRQLAYTEQDNQVFEFVNTLSDPVLLINIAGEVYAKNSTFEKDSRYTSLNLLDLNELSISLAETFKQYGYPQLQKNEVYRSTIQDKEKRQYTTVLHPFIFTDTHIVIIQPLHKEDLLQKVLDCIPSRVFWKDANGKFLGANHLFLADCGVTTDQQLLNLTDYNFFPKEEADNYIADDQQVMSSGKAKLNIEECQTRSDGQKFWLQTSKVPILNHENEVIGIMGSYTDITERKVYQELIEGQARQDQLTKLHNRQALQEYFQILEQDKEHKHGSLLFIDLDNFKAVNDTLGHDVGDTLLQIVSNRIKEATDEDNFVVRLGGDEFSVLLLSQADENKETLKKLAEELAEKIKSAILKSYFINTNQIQLGVSIGITYFYSGDTDWANTFKEADMAMYDAKAAGKNTIKVFSETVRTSHNRVYQMQSMLSQAIESNELYFNIQPQYNANEQVIGAEALLRWNNKVLGEVSPVEFIPLSEQSGTIHTIGM